MRKRAYPEFHKALMDPAMYPQASRKIKFDESPDSYFYKTGTDVYKIRKPSALYSSLAIKEAFMQEAAALGRRWAPTLAVEALPLVRRDGGFVLGGDGDAADHVLRISQLSTQHWLDHLLEAGRCTPTVIGRVARFLAAQHAEHPAPPGSAEAAGRPEHLRSLLEEIFYQSKKYTGAVLSEAMLEVVTRPAMRFIDDSRKLFQRRIKKGRIVDGHGAFVPEHLHVRGKDVAAVAPLDGQAKYRVLDAANDVAALVNALTLAGQDALAELFVKRYATAAKDRDLDKTLPIYRLFQAVHNGLQLCERSAHAGLADEQRTAWQQQAQRQYQHAVQLVRQIPRN